METDNQINLVLKADELRVEAVLFAAGKEISSERISSLCSLKVEEVEVIMNNLTKYYDCQKNSLKVVKKDLGWKLTVKDEYVPLVSSIVSSTELDRPLMETLAVIAWKYPVVQSEIVKLRGPCSYDHMRNLEQQGFIDKEKSGRTFKVKLTKKFFEYFDLPSAEAKQAFLKQVPSEVLQEAENVDKEADEVERLIELDDKEKHANKEIRQAMDELKGKEE